MRRGIRAGRNQRQFSAFRKLYKAGFLTLLISLAALWFLQTRTDGIEHLLGLCHGGRADGINLRFYLFDNLNDQQSKALTHVLQTFLGERTQAVHATHFGRSRAVLGLVLGFLAFFSAGRLLNTFRTSKLGSLPRFVSRRENWLLLGFPTGMGLDLGGLGGSGPYLFTAAGLFILTQLARSQPEHKALTRGFAVLHFVRLIWVGSLVSSLYGVTLFTLEVPEQPYQIYLLLLAVSLSYLPMNEKSLLLFRPHSQALTAQCRFGFHLGWMECTGLLIVLYQACFVGREPFSSTVAVFTIFLVGRVVHTLLLCTTLLLKPENPHMSAEAAFLRVGAGILFLAPLPYVELFWGSGPGPWLLWLVGLMPLSLYGRPWGTRVVEVKSGNYEMAVLSRARPRYKCSLDPKQRAAVLFMSLPPEMAAQLFSELGPEEVQAITLEITQLPTIAPEVRAEIINEFLYYYDCESDTGKVGK